MSSYADARDYYSYSASSFGDEVDTDPLCCCEYFDRNDERNHILACCCNCVDFDESCDRFVCLDFFAKAKVFGRPPLLPPKGIIDREARQLIAIHPSNHTDGLVRVIDAIGPASARSEVLMHRIFCVLHS